MEHDGSMKFITGEDLELWYQDEIKRNGTSREIGIWWSVTGSILQSSYRGDFYELEVEGFTRKIIEMQDRIIIKNKKFTQFPSDVSKGSFWGYAKQCNLKTFFISGSSGLANQDLQKIWQEELTSLTAPIVPRQEMERHMIYWFRV